MDLLYYLSFYPVALAGGAAALRLYSCRACSIDNWKMKKIFNSQFSIEQQRFFLVFNILTINKNSFLCLLASEGERQFKETFHVILR